MTLFSSLQGPVVQVTAAAAADVFDDVYMPAGQIQVAGRSSARSTLLTAGVRIVAAALHVKSPQQQHDSFRR